MSHQNPTKHTTQRKSLKEYKESKKTRAVIVLDNIRSALNIGSIFRTADAFLLEGIYICGISACPPNREIEKTALGATQSVDWKYFASTAQALKELNSKGYKVYAVEQASGSILLNQLKFDCQEPVALVFGNEVHGISPDILEVCSAIVEIPQMGTKHSLNVAVSAGMVIWELYRQLQKTTLPLE